MATTARIAPEPWTPWLTKREAAARARVSVGSIERAMRAGDLRYSGGGTAGARVLIHVSWLDAWLEDRQPQKKREGQ